jgi:hypothetical protein
MNYLKIKVSGVEALVDFDDFSTFMSAVSDTLTVTHRRIHPQRQARPNYLIRDLEVGSAIVTLAPAESTVDSVFEAYLETLASIRAGIVPHGRLSSEDLRSYRKLGRVLESKTAVLEIGDVEIDSTFITNCDRLIEGSPTSFGQVVGLLQGVNTHRSIFFRLYPEGQNSGAECHLRAEGLYEKLMKMFDKRVRLTGKVRRNPDGSGVDRVEVVEAELMPSPGEVPTLASLAGIWKNDRPFDLNEIRASWND